MLPRPPSQICTDVHRDLPLPCAWCSPLSTTSTTTAAAAAAAAGQRGREQELQAGLTNRRLSDGSLRLNEKLCEEGRQRLQEQKELLLEEISSELFSKEFTEKFGTDLDEYTLRRMNTQEDFLRAIDAMEQIKSNIHSGSGGGGSYDGEEEATRNDKAQLKDEKALHAIEARLDALTAEWGMKVRGGAGLGAYSASV